MSRPFWPMMAAVAVGLCASAVSGPIAANAADLPARVAPPPPSPPLLPVFTWTGIYAGVQGGYEAASDKLNELLSVNRAPTGLVYRYSPDGFVGGGHVGANYQFQSIVVGIVGDVEGSTVSGGFVDNYNTPPLGRGRDELPWRASVRGRLGYTFGNVLVFATGGVAFAGLDATFVNLATNVSETISKTETGWTVGGGLSYALNEHWFLTGEYRHTDYGRIYNVSRTAFSILTAEQYLRSDSGEVGISYKF